MKKLIIILILGMFGSAYAQEPVYNQMRSNYQFRGIRVDSLMLIPKFNDTSAAAYLNGINGSLIRVDSTIYLRFNKWLKLGGAAGSTVDTTSLSQRIEQRVRYTDTMVMLDPYLLEADTSSLSFRIDSRVKYTDTSTMLQVYLRKGDTASLSNRIDLKIDSLKKSGDSVYFKKSGAWYYSFKDSIGGGGNGRFGNDTATVVMALVHNDAGSQLTNGEVVYLAKSGTSSDAPSVKRAVNKADSTSANTFGFVHGNIANNDTGYVVLSGKIEKLNTSAFANGDIIYLDSIPGKWTKTKPQAPYHLVYLGAVVKANNGNGSIFVKPQNGYEIEELHDVQINNRVNNQIIAYSDTQKVWKNRNVYSVVDTSTWSLRIDQRVKYTDTATMLNPYLRKADTSTLSGRIDERVRYTDTAALVLPYLRKGDTLFLSNRIDSKLNISDTSVLLRKSDTTSLSNRINLKQDKSISAYSMLVNNTNAAANMSTTQFQNSSGVYNGTINWTGTAPTGTTDHSYRWQRVGNVVNLTIHLFYQNAGSALTQVLMALPSDAPTPLEPPSYDVATGILYYAIGQMSTTNILSANTHRACLRSNAANNGYELQIASAAATYKTATISVTYFAQ